VKPLRESIIAIVGLGQIGASIGRVLVARRACRRVIGVSRKASTLRDALQLRAAHEATRDLARACARADVVILATPVRTILRQIPSVSGFMKPGSLLMDVGSTKGEILRCADEHCGWRRIRFVGGHPMSGHSGSGPSSSDPALFDGHPFVLIPAPRAGSRTIRIAAELVHVLGARIVRMDADVHDGTVALISHLPHVIAIGLMLEAAAERPGSSFRLAAGSFRDATRVAASDTDMLLDIFLTNRRAIGKSILSFGKRLLKTGLDILTGDEKELRRTLALAGRLRRELSTSSR
jgi:prephenate dehydrogenase